MPIVSSTRTLPESWHSSCGAPGPGLTAVATLLAPASDLDIPGTLQPIQHLLSCDGQLYFRCPGCSVEHRCDWHFLPSAMRMNLTCAHCQSRGLSLLRHQAWVHHRCADCGHQSDQELRPGRRLSCAACGSAHSELLRAWVQPPFPRTFFDLASSEQCGIDVARDVALIARAIPALSMQAEHCELTVLFARFCRRLCCFSYADDAFAQAALENLEANLYWEVFRRNGELKLGLSSYRLMVSVVTKSDALHRADREFNQAAIAYSLLVKYGNVLPSFELSITSLHAVALNVAEQALASWETAAEPDERQVFKLLYLLGQLHELHDDQDDHKTKLAISYLRRALAVPEQHTPSARERRGAQQALALAISRLEEPPEAWRAEAESLLTGWIKESEHDRNWSDKYLAHRALADLAMRRADLAGQRRELEAAAALAEEDLRLAWLADAEGLSARAAPAFALEGRAQQHQLLFDELSDVYAAQADAKAALATTEVARGCAVRVLTMPDQELTALIRQRREEIGRKRLTQLIHEDDPARRRELAQEFRGHEQALAALADEHKREFVQLFGDYIDEIPGLREALGVAQPRAVAPLVDMESIYGFARNTLARERALVSISMNRGRVTLCRVDHASCSEPSQLAQWRVLVAEAASLGKLVSALQVANELRAARLRKLARVGQRVLLGPAVDSMRRAGIDDVVCSLPMMLSLVPLEASVYDGAPLVRTLGITYVPSLAVAADLIRRSQCDSALRRMLVIGYDDEDLPAVAHELQAIVSTWGSQATVLAGNDCTKPRVLELLQREPFDIVHFACHGSFDMVAPLRSA